MSTEPVIAEGARVTRYEVNLLPESYAVAYPWAVEVEYRDEGKWAVIHFRFCWRPTVSTWRPR